jgi:uncharacterized protein
MSSKEFLEYKIVRNNALKLAFKIYRDGFIPDVIYVSLRGGAYLGNVISEFFKLLRKDKRPVFYAAVVARSYSDIKKNEKVMIDGWTYDPDHLRHGDKVLLIDDIFDSGNTINHLANVILEHGIPREDLKIAVHDYKLITKFNDHKPVQPDYYCRKHIVSDESSNGWIHYMSHELVGLTEKERKQHYLDDDPELKEVFDTIFSD